MPCSSSIVTYPNSILPRICQTGQSEVSWEIIGPCGEEADDAYYYYGESTVGRRGIRIITICPMTYHLNTLYFVAVYGGHKACPDGEIFLDGGAPYYKNYNEVCGGTEVPTPLSVDDIPDETTCVAGTDHYLLALSDSYGDGWLVLSISIYTTRTASTGLVNNNRFHNLSFQIQNKGMTMC